MSNQMSAGSHVDQLKRLLAIEERFRQLNPRFSTATVEVAAGLMNRMGQTIGALVRFLVGTVDEPPQSVRLEPAVIAAIARIIIEQHETFTYLCFEKIPESEQEFRRDLYYLHHEIEKDLIIHHLPKFSSANEDFFAGAMVSFYRFTLQQNAFFLTLSEKAQKALLSGKSAFYNSQSGGHGRGISRDQEISALYKLFSNVIHATSLGSYAVRTTKHRSQIDGHNLVSLALCCAVRFFARSMNSYTKLRPKIRASVSIDERKWLAAITQYPLEMWPRILDGTKYSDSAAPW